MEELTKEQEELLIESAKTSEEGFGTLYERYFNMVFHYILKRTGDIELAADLTSETFMKILHYLPKYKVTEVRFSSWIYRIATNQINQHFRKKSFISIGFFLPSMEPVSFETADEDMKQWEEEKQNKVEFTLMMEYVKKLKDIDQSIITLRYFENRKFSEISEILNLREGTIKVRMNRSLNKLNRWMKGETQ
ncbi:MAG: sigma-70 family RNA polymerase sigma factor [Candidatus Peregrinibacteria bacterium]|nr:sigma-70 family RNA polymerase sigma factor [Candidatus Peregrinibacteria bacterium]MDZ4244376.1 sigma-70 family RNA polymerase sigma factor [Candidatus Gracilibacteria bacterium]